MRFASASGGARQASLRYAEAGHEMYKFIISGKEGSMICA